LPMVRPVGAVIDAERVEVRIHPELKLDDWRPGDYRLTDAAFAADQTRVLSLVGTLLPPGADEPFRRPPHVRVSGSGPDFTTSETVEWRLDGTRSTVTARIAVKVRRGPLFQLTFRTPTGATLDRVTATPDDLISDHQLSAASQTVTVEFFRPLAAGQQAEFRLDLRGPAPLLRKDGSRRV